MHTLARFEPGRAASSCRPFAIDRSGFALGEGAAFLVLESAERALERGARIYAELAGSGVSCDASHLTKPDVAGQVRALRAALRDAGVAPSEIGYCNAHGTATPIGDVVESAALAEVWGADLEGLRVGSTKSMHGHLLGAAGALEGALTVLALYHRRLPPSVHCEAQDPACAIRLVGPVAHEDDGFRAAISSSFAFGGTNAVLVFRRAP
jgi:3-oxoacyl-[acyl-carrier-protein] synthase II